MLERMFCRKSLEIVFSLQLTSARGTSIGLVLVLSSDRVKSRDRVRDTSLQYGLYFYFIYLFVDGFFFLLFKRRNFFPYFDYSKYT